MNSELAERPAAEMSRQSSPESDPEPEPVPIYRKTSSMMSIDELNELFEVNQY